MADSTTSPTTASSINYHQQQQLPQQQQPQQHHNRNTNTEPSNPSWSTAPNAAADAQNDATHTPTHIPSTLSPQSTPSHITAPSPQTPNSCNCTKIAIMQLFHEMKQEFATVPDYLVCQYVSDNCHDRAALVAQLRREAARHPAAVQAYPQALRNHSNQHHSLHHQPHKPNETKPPPPFGIHNSNHHQQSTTTTSASHITNPPAANPVPVVVGPPSRPHRPPPSPPAFAERRRIGLRNAGILAQTQTPPIARRNESAESGAGETHVSGVQQRHYQQQQQQQQQTYTSEPTATQVRPMQIAAHALDIRISDHESNPHSDTHSAPHAFKPKVPQRPSTLSLPPQAIPTPITLFTPPQRPHPGCIAPVHRAQPTRTAPRPPAPRATLSASSTATPPSPINVSVNVTVSQVNGGSPSSSSSSSSSSLLTPLSLSTMSPAATRTVHHRLTTELSVQPEPWQLPSLSSSPPTTTSSSSLHVMNLRPFGGDGKSSTTVATTTTTTSPTGGDGTPLRSFTSVQFKLRSPTAATDSETSFTLRPPTVAPIDISAGPSLLTYSSASYDARKGLHSNFQITVDGGGNGTISAMRTRPNYTRPPMHRAGESATTSSTATAAHPQPAAAAAAAATPSSSSALSRHGTAASASTGSGSNGGYPSWDEADIVHRQLLCKQRLCVELDNDRMRLARMQHEINTLRSPIPVGGSSRLEDEIERLQSSCKRMVQQVEEAGPYVLGETNEAFYHKTMSGQTFGRSTPRPTRPPPPQHQQSSATASQTLSPSPSPWTGGGNTATFVRHHHPAASQHLPVQPQPQPQPPTQQQLQQLQQQQQQHQLQQQQQQQQQLPWACNMCTFQNHPLLNKCEQCEMPLLTTSGTVPTQTDPFVCTASLPSSAFRTASSTSASRAANSELPPPPPTTPSTPLLLLSSSSSSSSSLSPPPSSTLSSVSSRSSTSQADLTDFNAVRFTRNVGPPDDRVGSGGGGGGGVGNGGGGSTQTVAGIAPA